ncbi:MULTISPECIES: trimeric intracellular cation channel family protein [Paenibacillus]|uniref:Trimeric intracellular cation channel family protein n=1 Tax=Paenibacillus radicis (ex Xue et al. 2023) TaxID=2972489 RepID=A0ABT1YFX6_9BACL|nr:trimeric intracellular cation channel family protein [Paenibacillus radicis (ex Xue et al. 2023)]MCR8631842.1 trimeric intracellular cation channel family protein [Paenibacillus radicis (ex Xue et al. 2023)]
MELLELNLQLFSIIGTIAFAVSGAVVAMEEDYDILGVFVLALVTAFGGGVVRNLLIGVPVTTLWEQGMYLKTALIAAGLVFIVPVSWIRRWKTWESLFDAIGLAAFSIQGALYAANMNHPISAIMVAAVMTGIGGGIIRDVLAGRKPLVLQDEIYAVWGMLAGLMIGLGWFQGPYHLITLFVLIVALRMLSVLFKWRLPRRSLRLPSTRVIGTENGAKSKIEAG